MIKSFLTKIETLGFTTEEFEGGNIRIKLECCPFWHIVLEDLDEKRMFPYFYLRKKRVEEVTDLHDIIPTVLTTISKCNGSSSFRFLGQHNEFSGIDDELYGMYWFPAQPLNERVRKNSQHDFDSLYDILFDLFLFHMYQGDILGVSESDEDDFSYESPELQSWVDCIIRAIGESESYVANLRKNPNWFYLRSFSAEFSVFKSPHIANILKNLPIKAIQVLKRSRVLNQQSRFIEILITLYRNEKRVLREKFWSPSEINQILK